MDTRNETRQLTPTVTAKPHTGHSPAVTLCRNCRRCACPLLCTCPSETPPRCSAKSCVVAGDRGTITTAVFSGQVSKSNTRTQVHTRQAPHPHHMSTTSSISSDDNITYSASCATIASAAGSDTNTSSVRMAMTAPAGHVLEGNCTVSCGFATTTLQYTY